MEHAIAFVLGHIALHPLDARSDAVQDGTGPANGEVLLDLAHLAQPLHCLFNYEFGHGCLRAQARSRCSTIRRQLPPCTHSPGGTLPPAARNWPAPVAIDNEFREINVRKLNILAVAASLGALAACNQSPQEQKADNIEENAEATADNLEEAADNATTEAGEDALENKADATREAGEVKADATRNGAD